MRGEWPNTGNDPTYWQQQNPNKYTPGAAVWWEEPKEPQDFAPDMIDTLRANSLLDCARYLEYIQRDVHDQNLWNAQLYANRELAAFDWGQGALYRASLTPITRTGENIILMGVDSMVAQVGKNRPKATPVTRGASWRVRREAKKLDKFLWGLFRELKVYDVGKMVFRDACIFGLGAAYVTAYQSGEGDEDDVVCCERVFPDEILIDQAEVVATGKVRHLYRRRALPIEVVAEKYGVPEDEIAAQAEGWDYLDYRPTGRGWIVVVEGWQLPRGKHPGRWVASCRGKLLWDRPWTEQSFPFVFYQFNQPVSGFYSPSLVETGLPYQVRLNEINDIIRDAQDLMARPRLLVAEGSRVNPHEVDNMIGRIIKYTGIKPEAVVWPAVNTELYNERERVKREFRAHLGLNESSTSAQLPGAARLDSSAALREYSSIQDDRLADPAQRFESWYLDLAHLLLQTVIASPRRKKVCWYSGGGKSCMETIDWDAIDLDKNEYVLELQASSIFSLTPAAMRDELERQLATGLISPEEYRRQIAHPDSDTETTIQAAAADDIDRVINLLEAGKSEDPQPVQDLVNGVQRVSLALLHLNQYDEQEEPALPEIKMNFINWLAAARAILEEGTAMSAPQGPQGPPPQSSAPTTPLVPSPGMNAPLPPNF